MDYHNHKELEVYAQVNYAHFQLLPEGNLMDWNNDELKELGEASEQSNRDWCWKMDCISKQKCKVVGIPLANFFFCSQECP